VSGAVGRLHIRCRAPHGGEPAALALRGRLARTARMHLPDALRGALERRGPRVYVDRVDVALDFDPDEYDDVTVAALWARLIADAVDSAHARGSAVRVFADSRAHAAAALDELGRTGVLGWVFEDLPCGAGAVRAARLLEAVAAVEGADVLRAMLLEDEPRARRLYERMPAPERVRVLRVLASPAAVPAGVAIHGADGGPAGTELAHGADRSAAVGPGRARGDGFEQWLAAVRRSTGTARSGSGTLTPRVPGTTAGSPGAAVTATSSGGAAGAEPASSAPSDTVGDTMATAGRSAAGGARPAAEASAAGAGGGIEAALPPAGTTSRVGWWSIGGGLVLLWPWLGELLASELPAVEGLPGVPPLVASRMWAVAGLLGEERDPFVPDPLVRLLAGDDLAVERPFASPTGAPVPEAAAVLRSFAAALPGFAEAGDPYLREHLLLRGALIEPLDDGAMRVRIEPRPLDPVLTLLPYPLGPFKLDGTPLVVVERRGA
jgi:hypothetical protein